MASENSNLQKKNIVVLGASYAGMSTAHYLLKHAIPILPDRSTYEIVLVSPTTQAMCRPACPRAMISDDMFDQHKLFVDIEQQFQAYPKGSFRFVHGTAVDLDLSNRTVSIDLADGDHKKNNNKKTETLGFHALVIATGASTPSPLLGLNRDERFLRASWSSFRKALPAAKSIVIAGGGPAGVETAGELGEHLNGRASGGFPFLGGGSKLSDPKVPITLVTAGSQILPLLRPSLATKAERFLSQVGVTVIKNARVKSVNPRGAGEAAPSVVDDDDDDNTITAKTSVTLEDGITLTADIYIPATGMIPNTGFVGRENSTTSNILTPDHRIDTNPASLRVDRADHPRIYAIGDVSSFARPAVHLILNAVPILCANIKRDLLLAASSSSASSEDRSFQEDTREMMFVPVGRSKGVGAAIGYALPSWLVWLIKGRDYWLWTTGGLWNGKQWSKES